MNIFKRFFGHLHTVNKHRREVRKLCFKCGLYWQGLTHDLSKYSPVEFFNGVKYYTGTASPHVTERADKGHSDAWLHHKGRNRHHAEYWIDIRGNGKHEPVHMPTRYLIEMVCDRIAASKIYLKDKYHDGTPLEYYESHWGENNYHIATRYSLEDILAYLSKHGEKETIKFLRELLEMNK